MGGCRRRSRFCRAPSILRQSYLVYLADLVSSRCSTAYFGGSNVDLKWSHEVRGVLVLSTENSLTVFEPYPDDVMSETDLPGHVGCSYQ